MWHPARHGLVSCLQHREWDSQQLLLVSAVDSIGFQERERLGFRVSSAPTYLAPSKGDIGDSSKTSLRKGGEGQLPKSLQLPCSLLFPPCFHSAITCFGGRDMQMSLLIVRAPSCPVFGPWHGDSLYTELRRWQHGTGTNGWKTAQRTSISSPQQSLPGQSWFAKTHCCFCHMEPVLAAKLGGAEGDWDLSSPPP